MNEYLASSLIILSLVFYLAVTALAISRYLANHESIYIAIALAYIFGLASSTMAAASVVAPALNTSVFGKINGVLGPVEAFFMPISIILGLIVFWRQFQT